MEGQRIEREQRHANELAVAQLTSIYANSQKTKPPYTKPSDFYTFAPENQSKIPANVCETFLSISRDQLLPSWVLSLAPVEEIQRGGSGQITKPRMWMTRGIAFICPRLQNGILTAGMAIIDDNAPTGRSDVVDIDTDEVHTIWIPGKFDEPYLLEITWSWESHHSLDMPTRL